MGKVLKLEVDTTATAEAPEWEGDIVVATVEVVAVAKGNLPDMVVSRTSTGCCYGAFGFEIAREYLLFATESAGVLGTSICAGSKPVAEASDDLTSLDLELEEPAP